MATDSYWGKQRKRLLQNYRFPLDPKRVHGGMAATFTVSEALQCLVVGLRENAFAVLDTLLPELREELDTEEWLRKKSKFEGTEVLHVIAEGANQGYWLRHGGFDAFLVGKALYWRHRLEEFWSSMGSSKLTQPNLLASMLLHIEEGKAELAIQVYEANEKTPLKIPPPNMRFTSNARSLLYLHLKTGRDKATAEHRSKAFSAFLKNATQWEHAVDPIPYVMKMDVARVARACWWLDGSDCSLDRVIEAIQ